MCVMQDSIQVHLKAGKGPITVLTCDIGAGEKSGCFLTLEESRIRTAALHTGNNKPGQRLNIYRLKRIRVDRQISFLTKPLK